MENFGEGGNGTGSEKEIGIINVHMENMAFHSKKFYDQGKKTEESEVRVGRK